MKTQNSKENINKKITIIGGGIAGISTAFQLAMLGYQITLVDPKIKKKANREGQINGTEASLGILMGNIFKRSSGRSWHLRQRSLELWPKWLKQINEDNYNIKIEKPLIKLANSKEEYKNMVDLYKVKKNFGIELLTENDTNYWSEVFQVKQFGGLISLRDGRINPLKLIEGLMNSLDKLKIKKISESATSIKKGINMQNKRWIVNLNNNTYINQDSIIICSSLGSKFLLEPLGYILELEPVLGQVINLKLKKDDCDWLRWPPILNRQGINFIHHNTNELIMGATLERKEYPSNKAKKEMQNMNNLAPQWIKDGTIKYQWHGIRARPMNEPSPLLKILEPGLLLNSGHYRNGILLAPACAEWIGDQISNEK